MIQMTSIPAALAPENLDLSPSDRSSRLTDELIDFMHLEVFPAEPTYHEQRNGAGPHEHVVPEVVEELKVKARERGLWNLFLPAASGLTQLEYAGLAEISGWSLD